MSFVLVLLAYGASFLLAVCLLWYFHARAWYWHTLSVALALAIGVTPIPAGWAGPTTDLAVGSAFTFLVFWGVLAPLFRDRDRWVHHPRAGH
jgi:hypothetical protein